MATVQAHTSLKVLALARATFVEVLGPLEELMAREKSPQVGGWVCVGGGGGGMKMGCGVWLRGVG